MQSTSLRQYISLVEAAHLHGSTFWFNPTTNEVIPCSDHGECVAREPWRFDIEQQVQWEMEEAIAPPERSEDGEDGAADDDVPYEIDDHDATLNKLVAGLWGNPDGWHANDAWEQLAMNLGWVRVGTGQNGRYATYVSSSNAKSVWLAVNFLNRQGVLTDSLEIEVSRPQDSRFVYMGDETISQFLRAGTRGAENFLARLDTKAQGPS